MMHEYLMAEIIRLKLYNGGSEIRVTTVRVRDAERGTLYFTGRKLIESVTRVSKGWGARIVVEPRFDLSRLESLADNAMQEVHIVPVPTSGVRLVA